MINPKCTKHKEPLKYDLSDDNWYCFSCDLEEILKPEELAQIKVMNKDEEE